MGNLLVATKKNGTIFHQKYIIVEQLYARLLLGIQKPQAYTYLA